MGVNDVLIPPIATNLHDPPGTNQTAQEWYLYWQRSGQRINILNGMVGYGGHGDRLKASDASPGAIYIESDRSGVIYQNQGGEWHYLAGTMWGTISPDERPTDLGANDAGFEFRSIDTNPLLGGHDWIWSGTAWIEVTPNRYGTHASRLAQPLAGTWNGMIWVETDRSGVIYQNQSGVWHYLAGTMWGTVSPDGRPTGLGANDAGFTYRGTDQPRQFIWSGSAWTEVTPVGGWGNLIHPNVVTKVASSGTITEGGITDLSAGNSGFVNLTAAGNVGIGTASPSALLDVNGEMRATNSTSVATTGAGVEILYFPSTPKGMILSYDRGGGAYRPLEIDAGPLMLQMNGSFVGIGITASYLLQLVSDSAAKPGTSTWTVASDIRLKRNVRPFEGGLEVIRRLEPIEAEYNGSFGLPQGGRIVSFDAAKLREILPGAVSSVRGKLDPGDSEETDVLGVNLHEVLFHMMRAIQQLDREVQALKP